MWTHWKPKPPIRTNHSWESKESGGGGGGSGGDGEGKGGGGGEDGRRDGVGVEGRDGVRGGGEGGGDGEGGGGECKGVFSSDENKKLQ